MERKHEAEGEGYRLHFLESWRFVSHKVPFLPAFGLTIDSVALEFVVLFELPVLMYSARQRITFVSPILSI